MKFRLIRGLHVQYGKVYRAGDVVDTESDLVVLFRNKFERVPELEVEADEIDDDELKRGAAHSERSASLEGYGMDVTADFSAAEPIGLAVYRNGRKYTVVDTAFKRPLHDKPMTKKEDVRAFIDGMK
jgi:hypothetical protein